MNEIVYNTLVQLEEGGYIFFGYCDPPSLDEVMSCWFENSDRLPPLKLYRVCGGGVFVWENEIVIFSNFGKPESVCKIKDACVVKVFYRKKYWSANVGVVRASDEIPYSVWVNKYKAEKGEMPKGLPWVCADEG